ncbi:hypothetical protein EBX93_18920 [bacterium]|nr:hypothetical protein [bacterium]
MHFLRRLAGRGEEEQAAFEKNRSGGRLAREEISPAPGLSLQEKFSEEERLVLPLAEDTRAVQEACLEGAAQEIFPEGAAQEISLEGATPGPVEPGEVTGAGELPGSVATDAYEEEEACFQERLHDRVGQKNDTRCKELSAGITDSPIVDARFSQEEAASSSSDALVVYEDQRGFRRQGPTEAEEELQTDDWGHREDELDWSPISEGEGEVSELLGARHDEPSEQAASFFRPPGSDEEKISSLIVEVCSCVANGGSLLELNRLLERSHCSLSWKKINPLTFLKVKK